MNLLEHITSGFYHVIPDGYDHILFIISIIICLSTLRECIIVSLIFTISHSISLFLSVYDFFEVDNYIIESIIAASILLSALSNLYFQNTINFKLKTIVIFLVGLIHGLGFASVFKENYSNSGEVFMALLGFNAGVEIAQLFIVLIVFRPFISTTFFDEILRKRISSIISMSIGIVSMIILVTRLLN